MAPTIVKNPTYLFMVCALYLTFFSFFMFLINGSALVFTIWQLTQAVTLSLVIALSAGLALAAAAGAGILGSGSPEAGRYVWKGVLFAFMTTFFFFFIDKLISIIPGGMPIPITFILIVPPVVGALWALLDKTILSGGD